MQNCTRFPPVNNNHALLTVHDLCGMLKNQNIKYIKLVQEYEKLRGVHVQTFQQMQLYMRFYQNAAWEKENMCRNLEQELEKLRRKNEKLCGLPTKYEMMENVLKLQKDQLLKLESEKLDQADKIKEYREINFKLQKKKDQPGVYQQKDELLTLKQNVQILKHELSNEAQKHRENMSKKEAEIEVMKSKFDELKRRLEAIGQEQQATQKEDMTQAMGAYGMLGGKQNGIMQPVLSRRAEFVETKHQGTNGSVLHLAEVDHLRLKAKENETAQAKLIKEFRKERNKLMVLNTSKLETIEHLSGELQKKGEIQRKLVNENLKLKESLGEKVRHEAREVNNRHVETEMAHPLDTERKERSKLEKLQRQQKAEYEQMINQQRQTLVEMEQALQKKEETNDKLVQESKIKNNEWQQQTVLHGENINRLQRDIAKKEALQKQLVNENMTLKRKLEEDAKHNASDDRLKEKQVEKELKHQLDQERRAMALVKKQSEQLNREFDRLDKEHKHAKLMMKDLSQRLAAEMNDKLSRDERNLENVSIASRPMNITTEYQHLCTTEWFDAKDAVDEMFSEESELQRIQFLSGIFLISMAQLTSNFQVLLARLHEFVTNPFESRFEQRDGIDVMQRHTQIAEKMESSFTDLLRINADKTDISSVTKAVTQTITLKWPQYRRLLKLQPMQCYIDAVTRLTWKMVLQKPPMEFSLIGLGDPWQGEKMQTIHWGSSDPNKPGSKVICYVYPILMHGKAVMAKGTVLLN